jgi:uncharacterized repeat protein (TIGR03803 family)
MHMQASKEHENDKDKGSGPRTRNTRSERCRARNPSGGCRYEHCARNTTLVVIPAEAGTHMWTAPFSQVVFDTSGNLYGTTYVGGGAGCDGYGCGTAFRLAPDGTETVLHEFNPDIDGGVASALVVDKADNPYGTTNIYSGYQCNSPTNCGTAFMLAPDGTETVLHTFQAQSGVAPNGPLCIDKAGNLFGTMAGTSATVATAANLWAGAIFEIEAR